MKGRCTIRITILLQLGITLAALPFFPVHAGPQESIPVAALNATYMIEGQTIQLSDGRAEVPSAPGTDAKTTTGVHGKPAYGDLNGDGRAAAALFLMQDPGGSGTFYYIAAAIVNNGIYSGTNAVFLGDRVAPQNILIRNGIVIANFADRGFRESMSVPPSIGKTKRLAMMHGRLEEMVAIHSPTATSTKGR